MRVSISITTISALIALATSGPVPERQCDAGDVVAKAHCENPNYEALEFTRGPGDRYHQCCERYGVYLARVEHVSMEELENSIRQW